MADDKLRREQVGVAEKDDLANELLSLLREAGLDQKQLNAVMLQLVPYIVRRDHKVFNHAYNVGRASA